MGDAMQLGQQTLFLEDLALPPTQMFSDAELDVFCQNMLQSEDVSPLDLHLWEEQPPAAPAPPITPGTSSDATAVAPPPYPNGRLGRHSSNFSNSSVANGSRLGSSESAAGTQEEQDQQQMYAALFEDLMPDQLTYAPTGALTAQQLAPPTLLRHAVGSADGSSVGGGGGPLGAPLGSGEGFSADGPPACGSPGVSGNLGDMGRDSMGQDSAAGGVSGGQSGTLSRGNSAGGGAVSGGNGSGSPGDLRGEHASGGSNNSGGEEDMGAVGRNLGGPQPTPGQLRNMREKHRSAQRRYRARLRAKHEEADQRVEQLTRELNELKAAQSALLQRNTALEQHIATAQQQPQALPQQSMSTPSSVPPPPIPSPTPPPPLKQEPHSSPEQSSRMAMFEQPSLSNRYKLNDQTWELIKDSVGSHDDSLTFTVREGAPQSFTRRELSEFTTGQYKDLWKDYVNAFAVCLMRCNGNDKSPAYGRLLQLLAETRALKLTFCMLRPDLLSAWAQYAAEQRGMPTAAFWRGIAQSLTMDAAQLHKMVLVRNAALRNLGAMMAQRRELLTNLSNGTDVTVQLDTMTSIDALQTKGAAQRMDQLLRNENSFIAEISTVVTEEVLTPLQLAHVITLAWPFGVNIMAIMNVIAARVGAPPVAEMLRQGAHAGGDSLSPLRQALVAP